MLHGPEGDAGTGFASSGSSSCPMDVGLSIFWWLDLNDQIDIRNIKTSWGNVSSHQDTELLLFESFKSDLSLILRDISVHDFDVFLDFFR